MANSRLLKINLISFVLILTTFGGYSLSVSKELKGVFVIHRHGDRTPRFPYPNDPYSNESYWPDGWGQLTANGKRRMYKLGQYLRKRYKNFLTNNPREVFIRSSAVPRCLESAQLVAAGIYPPEGYWVWDKIINWLPFPVQTEPLATDGMLNPKSMCPVADNELNRVKSSPESLKLQEDYKDLLNYLSLNIGRKVTDIFTALTIFDTLRTQKENNVKMPEWVYDKMMRQFSHILAQTMYIVYSNKILQRLRAGLLLKELRKRFKDLTEPKMEEQSYYSALTTANKKLFIYSTHDIKVSALLNALGTFNMLEPPCGASVIFEVYSNEDDGEHIVKSFYLNKTESEKPYSLKLSGCANDETCTLGEFFDVTEELIPESWRHECGFPAGESTLGTSGLLYCLITCVVSIVFTVITMFIIHKMRRMTPFA